MVLLAHSMVLCKARNMTGEEFARWRARLGLTQSAAADRLGLTRGTIIDYESGVRRSSGKEAVIPLVVELACQAIEWGAVKYENKNTISNADDRPYASWIMEISKLRDPELELQGRRLFPEEWRPYPYVLIAEPEWDDPAAAEEVERQFYHGDVSFDWKSLPVAKCDKYARPMRVRVAVFPDPISQSAFMIAAKGKG
ncbi:helix-turn-helix domain-containing protein [Methylobacterium sp. CM6257]